MENLILGLGINTATDTVEQIAVGTNPWSGIKVVSLKMLDLNNIEFANAYIGFDGKLVNKGVDLGRYTKFSTINGDIIQRSYHILLKANSKKGEIYFVTDGISNPTWKTLNDIYKDILYGNARLANAKIVTREGVRFISAIRGEIQEVDITKAQLEYRKYLKSIG